jgi:hypothetical protein
MIEKYIKERVMAKPGFQKSRVQVLQHENKFLCLTMPVNDIFSSFLTVINLYKRLVINVVLSTYELNQTANKSKVKWCVYLSLFILATGCPYGQVLQKNISHFFILEDSARYRNRKMPQFQKLLLVL